MRKRIDIKTAQTDIFPGGFCYFELILYEARFFLKYFKIYDILKISI